MQRTSIEHNIEWLFDTTTSPSLIKSGDLSTFPFPYPPEVANGYTEHLFLPNGTLLIK